MKKERDENNRIPRVTKTCKVELDDGERRYPAGEFTLTEKEPGPTLAQFADEAFKAARASLAKLMPQRYRLVVIDGEREEAYGLQRWVKLVDNEKVYEARLAGKGPKQPIRRVG